MESLLRRENSQISRKTRKTLRRRIQKKKPNGTTQKVLTKPQNPFVAKPKAKGKSPLKPQRGPQVQHFCHHCGVRGHTRPNCYKLYALKKADS